MAQKIAWGIDIGESAVKAVKVRRAGDTVIVQEYHTVACESRAGEAQAADREFRVRNALTELQYQADLKSAATAVSLPGRDVFPRFIPLPPVEKKRIPEIVRYEARTQMPFPIEEVIWDYQPISGMDAPGEEVEVAFFAVRKATAYSFLTNLRLAHVVPNLVEITPLALFNFLAYDRTLESGTVVIDVGAANTDLVIVDGERFWTRSVAISGNDISRALQEKYQISFEEAENLKRKAAGSKQAEKIFGAMRPIVDDLIGEIQRSIGYYKAQARNVRIERVVLLGNSFKLPQLVDYFRKNLDYEVSVLDRLNRVRVASGLDSEKFEAELPSYAVALGLGIQALGLGRVNIDLMPRDLVRERLLRAKIPYAAVALVLLAMPLLVGYQSASREVARCNDEISPIEQETKRYQDLLAKEQEAADLGRLATDLNMLTTLGPGRSEWAEFVSDLNQAVNRLEREPFRLNSVRQISATEAAGMATATSDSLGKVGGRVIDEKSIDYLTIEVRFEKDTAFTADDVRRLRALLEEQRPRVIAVEGRQQEERAEVAERRRGGETAATGAASRPAASGWSYTFWVTYRSRPGALQGGSQTPTAPKAAPQAPPPKRPVKRPAKRADDLKRID
ncbi:MAG TPA: type IV pilus assembly protein PilM [Planctomycetota bacterium]|nr:type IV pilus assembly protein PilM [Planctomycetota bacterium]HRR80481.1 type IV pilus assembly protein PilM [Planctomycetota bacterium]HRT93792.1 type IV pilus assembly protein PilM [Planctomycetota bacterium]